ncbi:MAG: zinc dependent phospholipase C family protein [Candidatus Riflebacteria bacterium]|nr:zinc dependent phospholipase C family protein [Candidatus Riflebacteria bacterium]
MGTTAHSKPHACWARLLGTAILVWFGLAAIAPAPGWCWGAVAHGLLARAAVDRMPGPVGDLLRANRDFLYCYSVLPDQWWGSPDLIPKLPRGLENPSGIIGIREQGRHHVAVDGDLYAPLRDPRSGLLPVMTRDQARLLFKKHVDREGRAALDRFRAENKWYKGGLKELPQAMFEKAGELPWVTVETLDELTRAMKANDWSRAAFLATVLSHYVGDTYTPLHTVHNYNGQLHPNPLVKGIHGRWESGLVENFEDRFVARLAKTTRAGGPPAALDGPEGVAAQVFRTVSESCSLVDAMLDQEDEALKARHPGVTVVEKGQWGQIYDSVYYASFFERQGQSCMDRLDASADASVWLWRVAWERAGRPEPPRGFKISIPLLLIDWRNNTIVPFDPNVGFRRDP